jgi:hypothetical protein
MFEQSYQQLYIEKQVILLGQNYPCPRCKCGNLEPFGETETFICATCRRNFVAINAGRVLYPVYSMKTKIAPVFWWDGLRWHLAGTTASSRQAIVTMLLFILPILALDALVFCFNHGHLPASATAQTFWLNLALLNLLVGFFMAQLFYLTCWDHETRIKHSARQSTPQQH